VVRVWEHEPLDAAIAAVVAALGGTLSASENKGSSGNTG
jgi:hypothetical protein